MDFTGHKEMLREVIFRCDLKTLGNLLKAGKKVWEVLNSGDMEELRKIHIKNVEKIYTHGAQVLYEIRKDTEKRHGRFMVIFGSRVETSYYRDGLIHGESYIHICDKLYKKGSWYRGQRHGEFVEFQFDHANIYHYEMGRLCRGCEYRKGGLYEETLYEGKVTIIRDFKEGILVSENRYLGNLLHGWQIDYNKGKRRLYRKGKFRTAKPLKKHSS